MRKERLKIKLLETNYLLTNGVLAPLARDQRDLIRDSPASPPTSAIESPGRTTVGICM